MKLSMIYRKAAKRQEAEPDDYPCWAIADACDGTRNMWVIEGTPAAKFTKVFSTGSPESRSAEYISARYDAHEEGVQLQDYDVVALCFAAAIMEGK